MNQAHLSGKLEPLSESLFRHLPIEIQSLDQTKRRGESISGEERLFFNGPFAEVANGKFAIFGRYSQITNWPTRENTSRMVGTVVDLTAMMHQAHPIKSVFKQRLIEFAPLDHGYSVEDMRLTPVTLPDGTKKVVAIAVLFRGMRKNDRGQDTHDVSLGISIAEPDFSAHSPLERLAGTDDYKNGVFMGIDSHGTSYLLARSMYETDTVTVFCASDTGVWEQWEPSFQLPLLSHLPHEIQHRLLRLGPGTNPVELPERNSFISLFHWVTREHDPLDHNRLIEVYRGGLIEYSSVTPPKILRAVPYALSPFDHREEFRNRVGLFEDKQVVFPVGLSRTKWDNAPAYLVSYGFNDAYQHFAVASVSDILHSLDVASATEK